MLGAACHAAPPPPPPPPRGGMQSSPLLSPQVGNDQFCDVLRKIRGPQGEEAVRQWQHLQALVPPACSCTHASSLLVLPFLRGTWTYHQIAPCSRVARFFLKALRNSRKEYHAAG